MGIFNIVVIDAWPKENKCICKNFIFLSSYNVAAKLHKMKSNLAIFQTHLSFQNHYHHIIRPDFVSLDLFSNKDVTLMVV